MPSPPCAMSMSITGVRIELAWLLERLRPTFIVPLPAG